jgi:hypothetical protein
LLQNFSPSMWVKSSSLSFHNFYFENVCLKCFLHPYAIVSSISSTIHIELKVEWVDLTKNSKHRNMMMMMMMMMMKAEVNETYTTYYNVSSSLVLILWNEMKIVQSFQCPLKSHVHCLIKLNLFSFRLFSLVFGIFCWVWWDERSWFTEKTDKLVV